MTEINSLAELSGDTSELPFFLLDNRTAENILQNIYEYTALIPFDSQGHTWADFFFMADRSPQVLADLLEQDGENDVELLSQQAFLLAFLQLLKTPRMLLNSFPAQHRNLYY
ncbi:MAG: hypothetical protein ACRCYL_02530, partial [Kluyvera sp.]